MSGQSENDQELQEDDWLHSEIDLWEANITNVCPVLHLISIAYIKPSLQGVWMVFTGPRWLARWIEIADKNCHEKDETKVAIRSKRDAWRMDC